MVELFYAKIVNGCKPLGNVTRKAPFTDACKVVNMILEFRYRGADKCHNRVTQIFE